MNVKSGQVTRIELVQAYLKRSKERKAQFDAKMNRLQEKATLLTRHLRAADEKDLRKLEADCSKLPGPELADWLTIAARPGER